MPFKNQNAYTMRHAKMILVAFYACEWLFGMPSRRSWQRGQLKQKHEMLRETPRKRSPDSEKMELGYIGTVNVCRSFMVQSMKQMLWHTCLSWIHAWMLLAIKFFKVLLSTTCDILLICWFVDCQERYARDARAHIQEKVDEALLTSKTQLTEEFEMQRSIIGRVMGLQLWVSCWFWEVVSACRPNHPLSTWGLGGWELRVRASSIA